jgi:hypothetical protein
MMHPALKGFFMELTDRQKLTIEHLENAGIKTPDEIIKWALNRINRSQKFNHRKHLLKESLEENIQ